jgi:hypothetical protein
MTVYAAKPKPTASLAPIVSSSFASKMLAAFSSKSNAPSPAPSTNSTSPLSTMQDPFTLLSATLFLRTVSGAVFPLLLQPLSFVSNLCHTFPGTLKVTPSAHFSAEMLRATKKGLPSTTIYSLIWTGKDEFDASQAGSEGGAGMGKSLEDEDARRVFAGLLSDLDSNGRVFIGFPSVDARDRANEN